MSADRRSTPAAEAMIRRREALKALNEGRRAYIEKVNDIIARDEREIANINAQIAAEANRGRRRLRSAS